MISIFDPAHMIKHVKNAFGEKKIFLDYENNEINFEYIKIQTTVIIKKI